MTIEDWIGAVLLAWAASAVVVAWLWLVPGTRRQKWAWLSTGVMVGGATLLAVVTWPL